MKKMLCALLCLLTLMAAARAETVNAVDEPELNLFAWAGYLDREALLLPFEEETGIQIRYTTFASGEEMLERLRAANGGEYDVVFASDAQLDAARREGLMQRIDKRIVRNFANLDPALLGAFFDPESAYVVPYIAGSPLIVYDPAAVSRPVTGLNDLWDASLAGRVGLIDDARVTVGMVLLSMGESMNTTDGAVLARAEEKLAALAPNVRALDNERLPDLLLSGDVSAAYLFTPYAVLALEADPGLQAVYPEEGLGFGVDACFIPVNAPHAYNANRFLDYLLRPEIGAIIAEWHYSGSVNVPARDVLGDWYAANPVFTGISGRMDDTEYLLPLSPQDEQAYEDIWARFKRGL